MSRIRTLVVGVVVLVIAGALFLRRGTKPSGPGPRASGSASSSPRTAAGPAIDPAAYAEDTDRPGTLRLEGQVIDEAERPVAGAPVRIDAAPARNATTDVGGSFAFDRLTGRTYVVLAHAGGRVAGPVRVHLTTTS